MKLLETIKFKNGKFVNIELHQERMNRSVRELFGVENEIDLVSELGVQNVQAWTLEPGGTLKEFQARTIETDVQAWTLEPGASETGGMLGTSPIQASTLESKPKTNKCRISYNKTIQSIKILDYSLPKIKSLKIVFDDEIDYRFKFENRKKINQLFAKRENCHDILIVKNGLITDTSFCNILFYNGKKWLTPEKPLLKGTQRQFLLNNEIIETANISSGDIHNFTKARLVNAMIGFDDALDIDIEEIQKK